MASCKVGPTEVAIALAGDGVNFLLETGTILYVVIGFKFQKTVI